MNMRKPYFSLLTLLTLLVLSCTEEIDPTPYTYTKLFTGENSKTWKINFLEETLNGDIIDRFSLNCATDDEYVFYANTEHSFEVSTGSRKCNEVPEANLIEDTWTFTNANATLTMIMPFFTPDFSLPFIVRDVDKNDMELEIFYDEANTGSYRIHFEAIDED